MRGVGPASNFPRDLPTARVAIFLCPAALFFTPPPHTFSFTKWLSILISFHIHFFSFFLVYIPPPRRTGATRPERSGSSPYQNIHNSLAACNDSGGCLIGGGGSPILSKMPLVPAPPPGSTGAGADVPTRRHTHRISAAKQRENDDSTGSSNGSVKNAGSPCTSLRHLMPHRSV